MSFAQGRLRPHEFWTEHMGFNTFCHWGAVAGRRSLYRGEYQPIW